MCPCRPRENLPILAETVLSHGRIQSYIYCTLSRFPAYVRTVNAPLKAIYQLANADRVELLMKPTLWLLINRKRPSVINHKHWKDLAVAEIVCQWVTMPANILYRVTHQVLLTAE